MPTVISPVPSSSPASVSTTGSATCGRDAVSMLSVAALLATTRKRSASPSSRRPGKQRKSPGLARGPTMPGTGWTCSRRQRQHRRPRLAPAKTAWPRPRNAVADLAGRRSTPAPPMPPSTGVRGLARRSPRPSSARRHRGGRHRRRRPLARTPSPSPSSTASGSSPSTPSKASPPPPPDVESWAECLRLLAAANASATRPTTDGASDSSRRRRRRSDHRHRRPRR